MAKSRTWGIGRERLIFLAGASGVSGAAWIYLTKMPGGHVHGRAVFPVAFIMWTIMMIAMMLPSALPFVMAFGGEHRRRRERNLPYVPAGVFLAGYFALWTVFSALAAALQQVWHREAALSARIPATLFGGAILVAAGGYEWTPFKQACLRHCRSPLGFLLSDWREGFWGAFRMGVDHGFFCLGCCWLLMLLPFAGGLMNLGWMAAITGLILVEKAAPGGPWFGRVAGLAMAGVGVWMMAALL